MTDRVPNKCSEQLFTSPNPRNEEVKSEEVGWPKIKIWPYRVRWAQQFGYLLVEDPIDGSWHQVAKEDAPWQWVQLAMRDKYGDRGRRR